MTRIRRTARPRSVPGTLALTLSALVAGLTACETSTDVDLLRIEATGRLEGVAFLDLNGSGVRDAGDEPLDEAEVLLLAVGAAVERERASTNAEGVFAFEDVPVGRYTLRVENELLGDSLEAVLGAGPVEIETELTAERDLGVSFPKLTVSEARAAAVGRRVFTSGIALNARVAFDPDGRVFLDGGGAYLQATEVVRAPGVSVGDSVRFLGRTGRRNGQPVLDDVLPVILIPQAVLPAPRRVGTGVAAAADDGAIDAALVRIDDALISDTATVDGDFEFTADDGTGPVRVVLRSFLGRENSDVRPDTVVQVDRAVGMLDPHDDGSGSVRWRLLVRSTSTNDFRLENRFVDVVVTASFEPGTAVQGDTVDLTVVVRNDGPEEATGLQLADTLDAALTRRGTTLTRGTYASDGVAGSWDLGPLAPGAADTLAIRVEVTGSTTGSVVYVVRTEPLVREIDEAPLNNRASAPVVLEAP